jgi:hypothetical protein
MELDDDVLFLLGDVPPLDVRPKVVDPPQPAALAAPEQPCTPYHQQEKLTRSGGGLIISFASATPIASIYVLWLYVQPFRLLDYS